MGTIPDRIFELIVLQLDHEQTADEEKELAAWLAEKKEHRQWWESYLQIRAQAKLLDRYGEGFDKSEGFPAFSPGK